MKPFDERLFTLKLWEPSQWMQAETARRRRRVDHEQRKRGQGFGTGWLAQRVDSDISVLREYVLKVDQSCRETWLSDHDAITPDFIRKELVPRVFTVIAARKGATQGDLDLLAGRTNVGGTDLTPVLHHMVREIEHLKNDLATRYEIQASELAKQQAQVLRLTHAPAPPAAVGGLGIARFPVSKPTQIPQDLPPYYPGDLGSKTHVVLAEAVRKFPEQNQVLGLCKWVIAEMTSVFRAAVEDGTINPEQVLSDSGMGGLLHSLLVYNCDRDNERFQLRQEAMKSDEWLRLAREIEEVKSHNHGKSAEWAKFERRGDFIVLAEPSNDTATRIRHDYDLLKWNVRQFDQWVSQQRENGKQPTLQDAKAAFSGTILIGDATHVPYLTDQETKELIAHRQTPSSFAEGILVKRWGLSASTVRTYVRRKRVKGAQG